MTKTERPPSILTGAAPVAPTEPLNTEPTTKRPLSARFMALAIWKRLAIMATVGVAGAAFVIGTAYDGSPSRSASSAIENAATVCGVSANVNDGGASISFDTEGDEDYSGDAIEDVACFIFAIGVPDYVVGRIDSTRALDGTQDAAWDDYAAFWNYHPDSGMNLTVHTD